MALVQQNFSAYLRSLRIIFIALLLGQVIVLGVLYFVRWQEMPEAAPIRKPWGIGFMPIIMLALPALSLSLYRKKVAAATVQPDLKSKLIAYRTALLLRWAPIEVLNLFIAVLYFVTAQAMYLYGAVIFMAVFFTLWPHRANIVAKLGLSTDEQQQLDDPHAVVAEISMRPG